MPHPLRVLLPDVVYEVTSRTIQGRYLLTPTAEARDLILGVIGRAQTLYPAVRLHAFVFLSNHSHLLMSSSDGKSIASFVGYVNSNVAREIGRLHDWSGPFWGRRHRPIPVLDDAALVGRLRYVLAQGVKEGLVASAAEWPGASALPGLLGERLEGTWHQRNLEYRARLRGCAPGDDVFVIRYPVTLCPLPCWGQWTVAAQHAAIRGLLVDVEHEGRALRRERGMGPIGATAIARQDPHTRPAVVASTAAPTCHASTIGVRVRFREAYREIRTAFIEAARALARGVRDVVFPAGTFPPRLPFVEAMDRGAFSLAPLGSPRSIG